MGSTFGETLRVTVFGQSHSAAVGCVVEGLPSGLRVDMDAVRAQMARRQGGRNPWDTPRREADEPRVLSGLNPQGATCGAPLALVIENANTRSGDYDNILTVPRPGHADYTAWAKWHGNQDVPGGGHFSGRLTAPLVAAGAICRQELARRGVGVCAHLAEAAGVADEPLETRDNSPAGRRRLAGQVAALGDGRPLPVLDAGAAARMTEAIMAARADGDSAGGVVECVAWGLPAGAGGPMFDGVESVLARALFGIPAVKGVEVGAGFAAARLRGSEDNDPFELRDGAVVPATNNAGGILGGITTGAPVVVRCAVKPISSISLPQRSVDLSTMSEAELVVRGRHDACAAVRAVPVVEAVVACALLDVLLSWPAEPLPDPAPAEGTPDAPAPGPPSRPAP